MSGWPRRFRLCCTVQDCPSTDRYFATQARAIASARAEMAETARMLAAEAAEHHDMPLVDPAELGDYFVEDRETGERVWILRRDIS